jgi:hypothetical protein
LREKERERYSKYDISALLDNIVNVLQNLYKNCPFDLSYVMRNKISFTNKFILLKIEGNTVGRSKIPEL